MAFSVATQNGSGGSDEDRVSKTILLDRQTLQLRTPEEVVDAMVYRKGEKKELTRVSDALRDTQFYFIYFSAKWCPHCRAFTPRLREFYERYRAVCHFEVIFFSLDHSSEEMEDYFNTAHGNWWALPYAYAEKYRDVYTDAFSCEGIPMLCAVPRWATPTPEPFPNGMMNNTSHFMNTLMRDEEGMPAAERTTFETALVALLRKPSSSSSSSPLAVRHHHDDDDDDDDDVAAASLISLESSPPLTHGVPHATGRCGVHGLLTPMAEGSRTEDRLLPNFAGEADVLVALASTSTPSKSTSTSTPSSSSSSTSSSSLSESTATGLFPRQVLSSDRKASSRKSGKSRRRHPADGLETRLQGSPPPPISHVPALLMCFFFMCFWTGLILYFWLC